jgi:predicted permease
MIGLVQDLRYAFRMLWQNPMFTAVAVGSLAFGVGGNTAIFSLIDQVILRSLPVRSPEQLVLLSTHGPYWGLNLGPNTFSYPMYRDIRDHNEVFSGVAARHAIDISLSYRGQNEHGRGELVSGNYFEMLGVQPALGRTFTQLDDSAAGVSPVVILSYDYWRRSFATDPSILNQTLSINNHPMTIIGVAARGFHGYEVGQPVDLFVPIIMKGQVTPAWADLDSRKSWWLNVIARLKPTVTRAQAESATNVLHRQMLQMEIKDIEKQSEQFRTEYVNQHLGLLPGDKGQSMLREQFSEPLWVVMSLVGLVLLIACANLAGLLVARGTARQKEIAIRLSLGASRVRIIRQLIIEGWLLALLGGALSLLVANWTGSTLLNALPFEGLTRQFTAQPGLRILLFTTLLSLVAGLLFSLMPALQSTRPKLASTLKNETGTASRTGRQVWLRKALVIGQVALSLVLLVGSGLLVRSLYNLQNVDLGLKTDHLISFSIDPSQNGYSQVGMRSLFQRLQERLSQLPGVRAASMARFPFLTGDENRMTIKVEGYRSREDEGMSPILNFVGPQFFSSMGIPLIAGREFTLRDGRDSPKVVIINEKMARYFFGDQNAIGRHIGHADLQDPIDIEIVGVVKDSKTITVKDDVAEGMYFPYQQDEGIGMMTFYTRTTQPPQEVADSLRRVVKGLDPSLPIFALKSMQLQVSESLSIDRLIALLSASFGLLAILMVAVGLYGVTAYSVVRRTREIGIRVALGATDKNVLRLVMHEVILMTGLGVAIGFPAAFALSQVARSWLFGLTPYDPLALTIATALLIAVTLLSGFLPARRATKVDPMVALRYE